MSCPLGKKGCQCVTMELSDTKYHVVYGDENDPVNTPAHYRWLPVEAIEITELFNFCTGNALKYILRADHKGKPIEDLEKAVWYLQREIANRKKDV